MAALTEKVVRGAKPYLPPAIAGLFDILDQHAHDRPDAPSQSGSRFGAGLSW